MSHFPLSLFNKVALFFFGFALHTKKDTENQVLLGGDDPNPSPRLLLQRRRRQGDSAKKKVIELVHINISIFLETSLPIHMYINSFSGYEYRGEALILFYKPSSSE